MRHRFIGIVVFLVSLVVYLVTLYPHCSFTDAGELAGACVSLGVAHPTGYPLFVMLGFLWTHLPLPLSVVMKLNVFAAVCTAASTFMLYLLSRVVLDAVQKAAFTPPTQPKHIPSKTQKSRSSTPVEKVSVSPIPLLLSDLQLDLICAAIALCYAFAQTVWAQAVGIEVYSLHLTMLCTTLYWILRAAIEQRRVLFTIAALFFGLSFTNHLTTILIIIPVSVLFFYRPGQRVIFSAQRRREFLQMLLIVMSCAIVYAYLPLSSSNEPWFNWGGVHRGWEQFSYHVFGKQYSVWMFSDEAGVVAKQFGVFIRLLPFNTAVVGIPLALWGLIVLYRSTTTRSLGVFFTLMIVCGVSYSVNYNIHDIDSYFLSSYIACIILAGVGLHNLLNMAPRLAFTALALPLVALSMNWKHCDQHDNVLVRDYVRMMVEPLPQNAVVISQQWDFFCSAFWYMQQVEGYRPDVTLIEKELLRRTWFAHQLERWYPETIHSSKAEIDSYMIDLRDFEHDAETFMTDRSKTARIQSKFIRMLNSFVDKNLPSRPVFVTQEVFQGEEDFAKNHEKTPFGLLIRLSDTNDVQIADTSRLVITDFVRAAQRHHSEHLEQDIAQTASRELENNARYLLSVGRPLDAAWFADAALKIDSRNTRAAEDQRMIRANASR